MIRQLAKTCIPLSGEFEWRFILGRQDGELVITDLVFGPVSPYIIFNNYSNTNAMRYSHKENIKTLYDKTSGTFFNPVGNSLYDTTKYPVRVEDVNNSPVTSTMDKTFDMGMRREKVHVYGKQFSFFCPFWMDAIEDFENGLRFTFNINGITNDVYGRPQTDGTVVLYPNNTGIKNVLNIDSKHNTRYFNYILEFIKYIGLDSNLLNISFDKDEAFISGIDVTSGSSIIKNVTPIIGNLTKRERPLIEQMNLLLRLFSANNIITKQLFNFRFYFDLDDIVFDVETQQALINKPLTYAVSMSNDENYNIRTNQSNIGVYDFYSNFDFVSRLRIDEDKYAVDGNYKRTLSNIDDTDYNTNALEYMRDTECIDLIYTNKIKQQTIFWTMFENQDSLFQLYDGLAVDVYAEDTRIGQNVGRYWDQPYIASVNDTIGLFSYNWVNFVNGIENISILNILTNTLNLSLQYWAENVREISSAIKITKDTKVFWVNGLKYNIEGVEGREDIIGDVISLYMVNVLIPDTYSEGVDIKEVDGDIFIITYAKSLANLSIRYAANTIDEVYAESSGRICDILHLILDNLVKPKTIELHSTLDYQHVPGPSSDTVEFKYCTNNENKKVLYRYSGNLYPKFIPTIGSDLTNFYYCVKQFTNLDELDTNKKYPFSKLLTTNYKPEYPSIDYFSLRRFTNINYFQYNAEYYNDVINSSYRSSYDTVPEYSWYQASMMRKLKNTIIVENIVGDEVDDEEILLSKFTEACWSDVLDTYREFTKKYIIGLYDRYISYENIIQKEEDELKILYKYTIRYELK